MQEYRRLFLGLGILFVVLAHATLFQFHGGRSAALAMHRLLRGSAMVSTQSED